MKSIATLTAIAALMAGITIASAQNPGGAAPPGSSPANINKGDLNSGSGSQSGSESGSTANKSGGAMTKAANTTGNGKFCIEISKGGGKECNFASIDTCQKDAQPRGLQCSPNPNFGTTGSK
jgi:hypothetical protein